METVPGESPPAAATSRRDFVHAGFLLTAVALVVGGALGAVNAGRLAEDSRSVAHSHEVVGALEILLSSLKDAETGQRGYLLVEDEKYLAPYVQALEQVQGEFARLLELASDNPVQQSRLAALREKMDMRLDELTKTVKQAKSGDRAGAIGFIRSGVGKARMDELRREVADLQAAERDLLGSRAARSGVSYRTTLATVLGATAAGLALTGAAFLLVRRNLAQKQRTMRKIAASEALKAAILDTALDCIVTCDQDGLIVEFNPAAERTFGHFRADVVGKVMSDIIVPPAYRARHRQGMARILETGKSRVLGKRMEMSGLRSDGSEFPVEFTVTRIDVEGPPKFTAYLRDITERKRAEAALQASEERFRTLADYMPAFAWTADAQGWIHWYNQRWYDYTGTTLEQMQGWGWTSVHHPDHVDRVVARLQRSWDTGEPWEDTFPLRGQDGQYRWFLSRARPIRDAAGAIAVWFGTNTDITEQRAAEAALRDSEARFRAAAGAVSNMIWTNDAAGTMVGEQPGWAAFTGQTLDEYQGYGWAQAVHPEDAQPTIEAWEQAVVGKRAFEFEHRLRRRDGEWRACAIRAVPVFGADGAIREWVGVHTDVTERQRTEAALRDSEAASRLLAAIVTSSEDAIVSKDLDSVVTNWNKAAEHVFGYSAEEMIGRSVTLLIPEEIASEEPEIMGRILRGESVPHFDTLRQRKDGRRVAVSVTISPIFDRQGRVVGASKIARDVSERKRVEAQLQQSEEELRRLAAELSEADRRKDEFLATLAHELRNPLAPIRTGLQIIRMSAGDAVAQVGAMMERQVGQMVHLVDDLLDVSRVSRGKLELRRERLELAAVLGDAVETSRPALDAAGHQLTVAVPAEPIFLDADATRLVQVFANLLNNAAKYTERGGRIALTAEREGDQTVVRVEDTGIGIPREQLPKVFEIFAQVNRSQEQSQGGLGIGLSLVKRLVEMHGGSVEARSAGLGKGSEFVVRLPVAAAEAPAAAPGEAPPGGPAVRRRILVADDNVDAAESLAMLLTLQGNEVRTAHDGARALAAAAEFRPQVVLLDIGMPKLNGYEVCRRIRALPWGKEPYVVALTGWGQDDDKRRSQEAGFDRHLVKPVDPEALARFFEKLPTPD